MRRQTSKVCGTPLPHYLAWAKSWRGSIASNAPNTPLQPRNIETRKVNIAYTRGIHLYYGVSLVAATPDRHGDLKDEDHEEGDASGLCTRVSILHQIRGLAAFS